VKVVESAVSYQYDINGNITNKSDVGDYSYNAVNGVNSTHPHTPNSIAGLKTHANNQDNIVHQVIFIF
jgi:hypothetical protein